MVKGNLLGFWAFLVGVLLAIVFAFFDTFSWVPIVLLVLGVIIGLLNIKDQETEKFMWAGLVLVLISYAAGDVFTALPSVDAFLNNVLILFVPATIVVVLKNLFSMAQK